MLRCLHIRSGRYHLLVHAEGVREVLDLSEDSCDHEETHGCRLWRGSSIKVLDLCKLFEDQGCCSPQAALVYGTDEAEPPLMLTCDQVIGLVQAEETSFRPLPFLEGRFGHYFDKALDTGTGQLLLLLKGVPGIIHTAI
jgi:hypothetical protein